MRRLIELARKDASDKLLVRATVMQLLVNWNSWYGGGFQGGVEMLQREGYALPEPTRVEDGTSTPRVMVSPDSQTGGPMLLGQVGGGPGASSEKEDAVKAEMGVMREDLDLLRHAVQARKAGKLEVGELAEARQAANDCSGWLQRLAQLLGSSVGGQTTRRNAEDRLANFSEATKEALRVLQQEMAELHRTFQAAYPGRKGFANSGTPRASTTAGGVEGQAMLHLGQTPRMREVFMASSSGGGGTDRGGHISEMFLGGGGGGQGGGQRGRASSPEMGGGMSRREAREDGFSPPHTSPKSGIDSPDRNSPTPGRNSSAPVVPKLRLGGAGGDAPVPPPQMPKLNLGGTRPAEPSQRSARGELSLGLPPAPALDLGAQLEIALGDDEDTEPAPDASSQMFMQEVAILQMQAEG